MAYQCSSDSNCVAEACSVDGCGRPSKVRGWCKPHYDAFLRTGDPTSYKGGRSHLTTWQKVQEIGWTRSAAGCLEYNGYRNDAGYGQFREGKRLIRVHRLAFETLVATIPEGHEILHSCDNPACSEPKHLICGSHQENMADMRAKRRGHKDTWAVCPNGHPYPADRPRKCAENRCSECARERNRRYHQRKKERKHELARREIADHPA